jgi:septal ring factor EnvC (AmiA/AmiB activator)
MSSAKVIHHLLLGTAAFGISFGLSLLIKLDVRNALLVGTIALPGLYIGTVVSNRRCGTQAQHSPNAPNQSIHEMSVQVAQLHQALAEGRTLKQQLNAEIQALKTEHNHLVMDLSALVPQNKRFQAPLSSIAQGPPSRTASKHPVQQPQSLTQEGAAQPQPGPLYPEVTALEVRHQELEAANVVSRFELFRLQKERAQLNRAMASLQHHYQETAIQLIDRQEQLAQVISQVEQAETYFHQLIQDIEALGHHYSVLSPHSANSLRSRNAAMVSDLPTAIAQPAINSPAPGEQAIPPEKDCDSSTGC